MTIKDIATLANVSISTVSKVLNNKDADISEETRKKVLKYVKEYQYTPYSKIKENALGRSYTLALIIPRNFENKDILISSVEKASIENGYHTLIYFTTTEDEEEKYIQMLSSKNMEAILLYSITDAKKAIDILSKGNIPLILLKEAEDDRTAAQVYINYEEAGYLATQHVIQYNHRNIGLLLCGNSNSEKIKQGYIKALYENDIMFDGSKIFEGQDELDAGKIGTHQFISMNVTAIICENEKVACSVYQTCYSHGLQIPKDISVISTSGMGLSEILSPKLDTVDLAIEEIGRNAVEAMISIIESKSVPNSCKKQVEISLIKRESVSHSVKNTHNQSRKIIVVGSMNVDVTINVNSLPTDGETLISDNVVLLPGGKGANQAVGAGKLGGLVYAIGCLGNDNDGKKIYNNLVKSSVKTDGINFDANLPTGKAYINVAKNGESTIVVYPGANNSLDKYQLKKYKGLFEDAEFCLLSLEISKKTAEYTINLCQESGTKVIVKPSTIEVLEDRVLKKIDYLVPNEKEIHRLVSGDYSVTQKAEMLFHKGVKNVIVTLGSKGCYLKNKDYSISFMAAPFDAFDTTGAADAFISAFAVFLSEGNDLIAAIKFATYSAGISITRSGAQPSMPDRMTIDMYQDDIINSVKEVL